MIMELTKTVIYAFFVFLIYTGKIVTGIELPIATNSTANSNVDIQCRIPKGYSNEHQYNILVLFGGRNTDGKADASGRMGWGKWCDENNVFILAPGFKDDNYWEPEKWSGQALLDALAELKKNYNVDTEHLLYYGYSAGSQASNLFAAWRPDLCIAWVSHACGYFHKPTEAMRNTPGLVTCGDADAARYVISRRFVRDYRSMGVEILWKTLPNHRHEVPMSSLELARTFLEYHLKHHRQRGRAAKATEETVSYPFVGNDLTGDYYPANSPKVQAIQEEERVKLPDRKIAEAWRKAAE